MEDMVLRSFLQRQREDAMALDEASDIIELVPIENELPQHYLVHFRCKGLVKRGNTPTVFDDFAVGIWLPDDYLRNADPANVLTWLSPVDIYNPNINPPFICIGSISPGTPLVDLCYRVWALIVGENFTPREDDALNCDACSWWRGHMAEFPLDNRPLKRRLLDLHVEEASEGGGV